MKNRILLVSMICTVFFITGFTFAHKPILVKSSAARVELNLIAGVEEPNEGVQVGSAYYLGELKSMKAVIPLMKLLHEGSTESIRISAAVALIKIGDSRGVFAVKQSARFDESEKVRRSCRIFYNNHIKTNKG